MKKVYIVMVKDNWLQYPDMVESVWVVEENAKIRKEAIEREDSSPKVYIHKSEIGDLIMK